VSPNPVNVLSVITFTVEQSGRVELIVVNLSGQKIRTLFSGFKDAGNYNLNMSLPELSKGVYFLRMMTEEHTDVTKFLIK
jgi:uncharacterized protein YfaS (alpha-2-macroglobulin family)